MLRKLVFKIVLPLHKLRDLSTKAITDSLWEQESPMTKYQIRVSSKSRDSLSVNIQKTSNH